MSERRRWDDDAEGVEWKNRAALAAAPLDELEAEYRRGYQNGYERCRSFRPGVALRLAVWYAIGNPSPHDAANARPVIERAMAEGANAVTVSGIEWRLRLLAESGGGEG